MNDDPFEIQKIKLKDLAEFARRSLSDPAFREVAPISLVRAKSQSQNPQGDPDDTALLVARHNNRCIGYHGLLPGRLKIESMFLHHEEHEENEGKKEHMFNPSSCPSCSSW